MIQRCGRRFLFVCLFLLFPTLLLSQTLSLAECVKQAVQASYQLQASEFRSQSARRDYALKKAGNLPQFFGLLSYEHEQLTPYGFSRQWSLLQADWALGDFLLKTQNIAQKRAFAASQAVEGQRLAVARRTVLLFIKALKQKEVHALLKQRLHNLQLHEKITRALWQSGSKNELDVLQTEAEILKLKEEMEKTLGRRRLLLNELALIIGRSAADSLRQLPLNSAQIANTPLPVFDEERLKNHPLWRMFHFKVEAARLTQKAVRASQLPRLQVSFGFVQDGDPTGDGNYWLASAGIRFPLFQWNRSQIARQKRQMVFKTIRSEQSAALRQLRIEAQRSLTELKKLKRILQLQQQRVKKTEQMVHLARTQYKAGLITNLEFLTIQEQFTASQIALRNTQLDYAAQLAQFYLVTNQPEKLQAW
ncbi:TolC family protein [Calditrichota bacterium LG25]